MSKYENATLTREQVRWACLAAAIIKDVDEKDPFAETEWYRALKHMVDIALRAERRRLESQVEKHNE